MSHRWNSTIKSGGGPTDVRHVLASNEVPSKTGWNVATSGNATLVSRRRIGSSTGGAVAGDTGWIARQSRSLQVKPTNAQAGANSEREAEGACLRQHDFVAQDWPFADDSPARETARATISLGQRTHIVPSAQMQLGRTPTAITVRSISPHVAMMRGSGWRRAITSFFRVRSDAGHTAR